MVGILRQLEYVYPYHQALGAYLEAAEYPSGAIEEIKKIGMAYDFFLTHDMETQNSYLDGGYRSHLAFHSKSKIYDKVKVEVEREERARHAPLYCCPVGPVKFPISRHLI